METFLLISVILLWIVVIALLVLFLIFSKLVVRFLNGFRVNGGKMEAVEMQPGEAVPFFREKDQAGVWHNQTDEQVRPTLLLFVNNTCGTCKAILQKLSDLKSMENEIRLLVIASSPLDEDKEVPPSIPFLLSAKMSEQFRVRSVPMAVLYGSDDRLQAVQKLERFEQLLFLLKGDTAKVS